jgi:hypothetical protein
VSEKLYYLELNLFLYHSNRLWAPAFTILLYIILLKTPYQSPISYQVHHLYLIMATIPSAIASLLNDIPKLDDKNWFQWKEEMSFFFLGAGVPGITDGEIPTEKAGLERWTALDRQLTAYIYTRVTEEYRYLLKGITSGRTAFQTLKTFFERSTMGHRMNARREFYSITHDPSVSIEVYFQALLAARSKLKALGVDIDDTEFKDVLLMHLHTDFQHVRASILAQKEEPSLDDIKTMLTGAVSATEVPGIIKQESIELSMAATRGRYPKTTMKVGQSSGHGPIDSKGYRWCNPVDNPGCHRCGRTGHVSARCMFEMPQHIKDWLMAPRSRSPSPKQPPHDSNAAFIDQVHESAHQAQVSAFGSAGLKEIPGGYLEQDVSNSPDVVLYI